jgi:hypothetical protein
LSADAKKAVDRGQNEGHFRGLREGQWGLPGEVGERGGYGSVGCSPPRWAR